MAWSFSDLYGQVLGYMDDSDNTGVLLTNVKHSINASNAQRAMEFPWPFMRPSSTTSFTCTTSTTYSLASDLGKLTYIYNTSQQKFITIIPDRHITANDALGTDSTSGLEHRAILRGPTNSSTMVRTIQFLRPPASGDVIKYDYYRLPTVMTGDTDYPDIPFPHSQLLVWDTLINMKAYTLEPDAIAVWQDNQQRVLTSLYATYGSDADIIAGEGEYLITIPY